MIFIICKRIKRWPILLAGVAVLASLGACGFRLQGASGALPPGTARTYIEAENPYSDFYASLRDALRSRGADVVESRSDASAILHVIEDDSGQRVLSVSARNVPREYEVYYVVTVSFEADGSELMPPESLVVTRSYTYDETMVLGKSAEEGELRMALARDLAAQVLRRLSAERQNVPTS
jgi:LPS-assembly lipoprotein